MYITSLTKFCLQTFRRKLLRFCKSRFKKYYIISNLQEKHTNLYKMIPSTNIEVCLETYISMKQKNYHHNRLLFRPIRFYIIFGMLPKNKHALKAPYKSAKSRVFYILHFDPQAKIKHNLFF